jgi:hypothetical protein
MGERAFRAAGVVGRVASRVLPPIYSLNENYILYLSEVKGTLKDRVFTVVSVFLRSVYVLLCCINLSQEYWHNL